MSTWIRIETGPRAGEFLDLDSTTGRVVIGSDEERVQLAIEDDLVAPLHVVLGRLKDGSYGVRATAPENAFLVNDVSTEQAKLRHGDRLVLGSTELTFHEGEPVPPVPEAPVEDALLASLEPLPATASDPMVGKELGGYRVLARLGVGGMGKVYRALQISLDREVALKLLSEELAADEAFTRRFLEEARHAGKLTHPNVVQVYDVGRDGPHSFYSMEYLPGGTLEDRLKREGRLPWRESVAIVRDAAKALSYAESLRIVHRDIKPDNLMLDPHGHAKVADLGLAGSHHESTQHGGAVLGTPHFISPEQALGKPVDSRSDLYSLGATFYRLLTGRTPFRGKTVKEIIRAQVQDDPEPVTSIAEDVPVVVELVVARMMAKDPDERHQSAKELIEDLDAILEGRASVAGSSKAKLAFAGIALAALSAIAFFVFQGNGDGGEGRGQTTDPRTVKEEGEQDGTNEKEDGGESSEVTEPRRPTEQELETARQLREAQARIAFDEALSRGDRIEVAKALRAVQAEFEGTEYGSKAAVQAQAREDAQKSLTTALEEGRLAFEKQLEERSFESALDSLATSISGLNPDLQRDPLVASAWEEAAKRVALGTTEWVAQQRDRIRTLADEHRFQEALSLFEPLEQRIATLAARDPLLPHRDALLQAAVPLLELRDTILKERRAFRSERFENEALEATRSLFAESGAVEKVLQHAPGRAAEALDASMAEITVEEIRAVLVPHRDALQRAGRALERLRQAITQASEPPVIEHPESGRKVYLRDIDGPSLVLARRKDDEDPERYSTADLRSARPWVALFECSGLEKGSEWLDAAYAVWLGTVVREGSAWQRGIRDYLESGGERLPPALTEDLDTVIEELLERARRAGIESAEVDAFERYRSPDVFARRALSTVRKALTNGRFSLARDLVAQVGKRGRGGFFFGLLSEGRDALGLDQDE